jgi:hypothetical protein
VKFDDEMIGHPTAKILQECRRAGLKKNFDTFPTLGKGHQIIKALMIEVENHKIDGNVVQCRNDVVEMTYRPHFVALPLQPQAQQLVPQRIGFVEQDGGHGFLAFMLLRLLLIILLILALKIFEKRV